MDPIEIEKVSLIPARHEDVHVAFAVDAKYVQHMGVAITSVIVNNPGVNLHFHLVYDAMFEDDLSKLKKISATYNMPLYLYKIVQSTLFDNLKVLHHFSKAIYYRLLLPYLLPQHLKQTIYLDSDVICVGDIMKLWQVPLGDALLAANGLTATSEQTRKLGLKSGRYLQDGVMLMNLPVWREQELTRRVVEYVAFYPERIEWPEQDALSAVLDGQFIELPESIHTMIDCAQGTGTITKDSVIIHFVGMCKPWQQWCPDARKSLYWQYLQVSPWFGTRPDEPTTPYQALMAARLENDKGNTAEVRRLLELFMQRMVIQQ